MKKKRLTPDERAKIIEYYGKYDNKWTYIASLMQLSESTVRSCIQSYKKSGQFQQKLGRPPKITQEQKDDVIHYFEQKPETTLREANKQLNFSISSTYNILNENKIHYFKKIPIPNLTEQHKQRRIEFSQMMCNILPYSEINIIITDESTVQIDLCKGGIWRRRGYYPQDHSKKRIRIQSM